MAEVRIILTDQKDGGVSVALECDQPMSLLNRQRDEWSQAQELGAAVHERLLPFGVVLDQITQGPVE